MEIKIAPGAFDDFDGTQEELDQLMKDLNQMIQDGSLFENSEPVDLDLLQEENPEIYEKIMSFDNYEQNSIDNRAKKLN
jgi:hypothetical protein